MAPGSDTGGDTAADRTFGVLPRHYRLTAGLTQGELAEKAGVSERAISDLERGLKIRPHHHTVRVLADALGLMGEERVRLEGTVVRTRQPAPADGARRTADRLHLPVPGTGFVGREAEIRLVRGLLTEERVRLVTLTGVGGVGKTRLMLEAAIRLAGDFTDGVFFVPLSSVRDPMLVPSAIAASLGIQETGAQPVLDLLSAYLENKDLELVLDNFEHVMDAAPAVSVLLAGSEKLKVLVISRSPLNLTCEHELVVRPLSVPDREASASLETLATCEAAVLFVQRAQVVRPGFHITAGNAQAVMEICRKLDGLPLAIELAAARLRIFSLDELNNRLNSRLETLAGGPRDWPVRHQSLRSAIAWSNELLSPTDQVLFSHLAVFAGGFTLSAAEAICGVGTTQSVVADGLASLVGMGLLQREEGMDGELRFLMLETIREYAAEQLEASGDAGCVSRRHGEYYLSLAERGERELLGANQAEWLARLELEHDNFRAVLNWAKQPRSGPLPEQSGVGRRLGDVHSVVRSLNSLGLLAESGGYQTEARVWYEESLALFRGLDDKLGVARVLLNVAAVSGAARARPLLRESLRLCHELGDKWTTAFALDAWAAWLADQGDVLQAARLWAAAEALRLAIDAALPPADQIILRRRQEAARDRVPSADFQSAYEEGRRMSLSEALTRTLKDPSV